MYQLGLFLLNLLRSVVAYFVSGFALKWGFRLFLVTLFLSATLALWFALKSMALGLIVYFPNDSWLVLGFVAVMPENWAFCLSTYFAARLLVWAYQFKDRLIQMKTGMQPW